MVEKKNVFTELFTLSKDLALWQNAALRLLFQKGSLSKTDKDEILRLAKIELGIEAGRLDESALRLKASALPSAPKPSVQLRLVAIRNTQNVNALTVDQTLKFSKGMTVIYGETGSGKSSYARVMKKAFRARVVDEILPNVFMPTPPGPASAVFDFEENGQPVIETWTDGGATSDRFGRFAVLDSKCARFIINSESVLEFLPYGFELFIKLAEITDEVKEELIRLGENRRPNPDALKHLVDQTSYGAFVASLAPTTSLAEIDSRATFPALNQRTLDQYRAEQKSLESNSPEAIRKQLQVERKTLEAVKKKVEGIVDVISDERLAELRAIHEEAGRLQRATETAATRLKEEKELNGVGSEVWRELLKAAEKYSVMQAYPEVSFPARLEGAKCVLCQQPLSVEAQQRLERFWRFIQDETAKKAETVRAKLVAIRKQVVEQPRSIPLEVQGLEYAFPSCGEDVFGALTAFYHEVGKRVEALESFFAGGEWTVEKRALPSPTPVCNSSMSTIETKLRAIVDDKAITARLVELKANIAELEAKERFTKNRDLLANHLAALKLSTKTESEGKKINTRRITEKAKALQAELVTEEFKQRASVELGRLIPGGLKTSILGKPEKGRLLFRVSVGSQRQVSPEAIFSEGERTAIAMACFLAELASSQDNCGIVFDDPVSSFDHKIRKNVVDRLAEEAKVRQVIVMTHDLVFLTELMESINRHELDHIVQIVESYEGVIGLLSEGGPWESASVSRRLQLLEEWIGQARKAAEGGDISRSKALLESVANRLRSTWERAVEELLFCKVVERYSREVQTRRLDAVGLDDESVEMVFDGMSAASRLIPGHDAPAGENRPALSSDLLLTQVKKLRDFIQKQTEKNKTAVKRREHLKKTHAFG